MQYLASFVGHVYYDLGLMDTSNLQYQPANMTNHDYSSSRYSYMRNTEPHHATYTVPTLWPND